MGQFFQDVFPAEFIVRWIAFTVTSSAVVAFVAGWRSRLRWLRRSFLGRINVSLNSLSGGRLLIRTILEEDNLDVFHNPAIVRKLQKAARKTTIGNPILDLCPEDNWHCLNCIVNRVSSEFGTGFIRRDVGMDVVTATYVICLTSEPSKSVRSRKIRAMMIRSELLENEFVPLEQNGPKTVLNAVLENRQPKFEQTSHFVRWDSLKIIAKEFRKNPDRFQTIEICV